MGNETGKTISEQHIVKHVVKYNIFMDCCSNPSQCVCIMRLVKYLKYCELLDLLNHNDQIQFVVFCAKVYESLLNDYIHILTQHNNHSKQIFHLIRTKYKMKQCKLITCSLAKRYHTNRLQLNKSNEANIYNSISTELIFYRNTLDCIHCYLYHLWDFGYRYDHDSNLGINKIIADKKDKSKLYKLNNKKFSINVIAQHCHDDCHDSDVTFLDKLYIYVHKHAAALHVNLTQFMSVISADEYDTESLVYSLMDTNLATNIVSTNNIAAPLIQQFISIQKDYYFNTGFTFFYWNFYVANTTIKHQLGEEYQFGELFVHRKYETLKEELLNNIIYPINLYQFDISLKKSNKYMYTIQVRSIRACGEDLLHYEITKGRKLTVSNLLSIILYCDWTELSVAFINTFIKRNSSQTVTSVKRRNEEFAIWSKILRETVEYFGKINAGPFFVWSNININMKQFNIQLSAPISTSDRMEVVIEGSGNGMILQLANKNNNVRCWNCSWLSNFAGENEYLFIGGDVDRSMIIENIRMINYQFNINCKQFFKAMYYFECMIDGKEIGERISEEYIDCIYIILSNLIKHKLKMNGFVNTYPQYINDIFDCFVLNKIEININFYHQQKYFKKLHGLITTKISISSSSSAGISGINLLKPVIFKLFKNVKLINIYTFGVVKKVNLFKFAATKHNSENIIDYAFNLWDFLKMLGSSYTLIADDTEIIIKAARNSKYNTSWILKEWQTCMKLIKSKYKQKCYKVNVIAIHKFSNNAIIEDCFIIKKIPSVSLGMERSRPRNMTSRIV